MLGRYFPDSPFTLSNQLIFCKAKKTPDHSDVFFHIPSKPHTVCFKYHSPIYLTLTLLRIYESRISRKLRFLDTFAPQSYASSHPCPGPFCAPFHSFLSASAFLRVWISLRPISNSQLHTLLYFHLCPIYLVFFKGSWDISS